MGQKRNRIEIMKYLESINYNKFNNIHFIFAMKYNFDKIYKLELEREKK